MKVQKLYTMLCLAGLLIAASSCKENIPEIGEPFSKVEGLTANEWVISEVFLIDESNPARPERNISKFYTEGGNPLAVSFRTDRSFEVTPGDGLNFFPASGTWSFDNDETPTKIIMTAPDGEITEAPLGGPTRISDANLKINFVKKSCFKDGKEEPALGYRLVFNRK